MDKLKCTHLTRRMKTSKAGGVVSECCDRDDR